MFGLTESEVLAAVQSLLTRSRDGRATWVRWQESDEFTTETNKFRFFLKARDEDDNPPFILEIWRKTAQADNEISAVKVNESQAGGSSALGLTLSDLYNAAKGSAYGISDLSKDLLDDLND